MYTFFKLSYTVTFELAFSTANGVSNESTFPSPSTKGRCCLQLNRLLGLVSASNWSRIDQSHVHHLLDPRGPQPFRLCGPRQRLLEKERPGCERCSRVGFRVSCPSRWRWHVYVWHGCNTHRHHSGSQRFANHMHWTTQLRRTDGHRRPL